MFDRSCKRGIRHKAPSFVAVSFNGRVYSQQKANMQKYTHKKQRADAKKNTNFKKKIIPKMLVMLISHKFYLKVFLWLNGVTKMAKTIK